MSVGPRASRPGEGERAPSEAITCEGCGTDLSPARRDQHYCSARCRAAASRRREDDRRVTLLTRLLPDDPGRPE